MRMSPVLVTVACILSSSAWGATYYVAVNGNDSNNGTSKTTPWLHAPGMKGCTANCAAKTPQSGDSFILRGGDTWHFSTGTIGLPWKWQNGWDGTSGNPIYVGVDQTWFTGGSWTRPKLNGDNNLSTSAVGSCANNTVSGDFSSNNSFLLGVQSDYTTFDNLEFLGSCWQSPVGTGGNDPAILLVGGDHTIYSNLYVHGWTHTSSVNDQMEAFQSDNGSPRNKTGTTVTYSVIDGSDSDPNSAQASFGDPGNWNHNYIGHIGSGIVNGVSSFHDNTIEYIGPSYTQGKHTNAFYATSGPTDAYNNVIRHIPDAQTVVWQTDPCHGGTDHYWNNVVYDGPGANVFNIASNDPCTTSSTSTFVSVNNTVQTTNGQQCHSIGKPGQGNLQSGIVRNLHCVNDNSPAIVNYSPPAPLTTSNNVDPGQTNANATTQGYAMANGYSPTTTSGNVTVGKGINLTSLCTGVMVSLCSDTSFGVSYNVATHVVTGVGRVANARPSSGAWDIGAYQQTSSAPPPLLPPTLLSAVIQ